MLENLEPTQKLLPCKIRTIAESLEAKDRAILESALIDTRWTPYALATALSDRGLLVSDRSIRKHQLQQCSCTKLGK
jgi:hypothetical protein